jgi:hypothetical protein
MTSRRLVLHFDVNKTIIMKDSSKALNSVKVAVKHRINLIILVKPDSN